MTSKFQSKSGLPEAMGSEYRPGYGNNFKAKPMCGIRHCNSRRIGREIMPSGEVQYTYTQGYGEIVIRTNDGTEHGHVCAICYQKFVDQAGKDYLSVAAKTEAERVTQPDMRIPTSTPSGLVDHLALIERTVLKHTDESVTIGQWQRDKEHFQQGRNWEDDIADRYSHE